MGPDASGHGVAYGCSPVSLFWDIDTQGNAGRIQQQGNDNGGAFIPGERGYPTKWRLGTSHPKTVAPERYYGIQGSVADVATYRLYLSILEQYAGGGYIRPYHQAMGRSRETAGYQVPDTFILYDCPWWPLHLDRDIDQSGSARHDIGGWLRRLLDV